MYDCMRSKGAASAFWLGFWSLQLVLARLDTSASLRSRVIFKQCPGHGRFL